MSTGLEQTAEPLKSDYTKMAADIVSAYVSNNSVPASELPSLIASIHASLGTVLNGVEKVPEPKKQEPAVPIKKSVTEEYIICLEDGKKFRTLRRHLSTVYNMSPDDYRRKWNLPKDYSLTAPAYAKTRSELAKKIGLGAKSSEAAPKRTRKKAA